jgi:hypothetical protein
LHDAACLNALSASLGGRDEPLVIAVAVDHLTVREGDPVQVRGLLNRPKVLDLTRLAVAAEDPVTDLEVAHHGESGRSRDQVGEGFELRAGP